MASRSIFGPAGFGFGTRSEAIGPTRRREPQFEVGVDGHSFDDNMVCRRCGVTAWAWVEAGIPCRR